MNGVRSFGGRVGLRSSGCPWAQILHSLLMLVAEVVMLSTAKHLAKPNDSVELGTDPSRSLRMTSEEGKVRSEKG